MKKFFLKYGSTCEVFEGEAASEVIPILQSSHVSGNEPEDLFLRRIAIEMCEWNGKWYRFNSRDLLAEDMIKHGLLECVD